MLGDRVRLSRLVAEQERALAHYVRREIYPHSAYYRRVIDDTGLGPSFVRRRGDLARLPLTSLEEAAGHLRSVVLLPNADRIVKEGDRNLALRLAWARLTGRGDEAVRTMVDPLYRPIVWTEDHPLRVGWTASDLERLGEFGRRLLEQAGLRPTDLLVSLTGAASTLASWQLRLGARHGGLGFVELGSGVDGAVVASWRPTALAGPADAVERVLGEREATGTPMAGLRTVVVTGSPLDDRRRHAIESSARGASGAAEAPAVVAAWAPSGGRALWGECRGGRAGGVHTWPSAEVIEVIDGQLAWSAVGWRGTALLRVATGVAATVDERPCPTCGRTTPRVVPSAP